MRMELRAAALAVVSALGLGGCMIFGVDAPVIETDESVGRLSGKLDQARAVLMESEIAQVNGGGRDISSQRLDAYVRARRNEIDGLCSLFFGELSQIQNQARWGRDQFNIVAEFATMALGASGTAAEQLAVLSGAQLGINDSLDAAERAMLLSPDPHKVFQLVRNEQSVITLPTSVRNYSAAESHVRQYAYPCSFIGIQAIIDEALQERLDGATPGGRTAEANNAVAAVRQKLNDQAGDDAAIDTLPAEVLSDLYWLFVLSPAADSPERAHVMQRIPATARPRINLALANATTQTEVRVLLEGAAAQMPWIGTTARSAQTEYNRARVQADARALAEIEARTAETQRQAAQQATAQATAEQQAAEARQAEEAETRARIEAETRLREAETEAAQADAARAAGQAAAASAASTEAP